MKDFRTYLKSKLNKQDIVGKARDFFAIGKELDKGGYKKKYFYSDTMAPSYTIEVDGFKFAIINKKYVDKGDREVGDIAIGLLENLKIEESLNEGKRDNNKVTTAWKKTGVTDLPSIAKMYADAMQDANFHREIPTSKAIGAASKAKVKQLGDMYTAISQAAGWSGYAIANGTVQYLKHIGEEGAASKLLKAITKYDLNESLNERRIQIKRKYTENHPALTAGKTARVRNKILEYISDGKLTQDEFNKILSEFLERPISE